MDSNCISFLLFAYLVRDPTGKDQDNLCVADAGPLPGRLSIPLKVGPDVCHYLY